MNPDRSCTPAAWPARCSVTVIITACDQEQTIAAAIESSLAAVSEVGGEVIVVDSRSADRTVEIACSYPIRVIQLLDRSGRAGGTAPQVGYQHSRGDYLYVLDGGMLMIRGFLPRALAFLAQHPEAAGVGGRLVQLDGDAFAGRGLQFTAMRRAPAPVDRLDGGGLYRRRAIEESGYLFNRNLHSQEEFDLAVRLRSLGWKLWRIPVDVATQDRIDAAPCQLLWRRWRSRSACGLGELVRATGGRRRLRLVWRGSPELRICLGVLAWCCLLLSIPIWPLAATVRVASFATLLAAPWLLMLWRKRSPAQASYALLSWGVGTAGLLRGLLRPQRGPLDAIGSRVLQEPPMAPASRREHQAPDSPDRHRFQN